MRMLFNDFDHVRVWIRVLGGEVVRVVPMLLMPYRLTFETLANCMTCARQVDDSDNDSCGKPNYFHIILLNLKFIIINYIVIIFTSNYRKD